MVQWLGNSLQPMDRPVFILLCGLPGVGKTTYSRRAQFDGYVRLSTDDLLLKEMESNGLSYQETFNAHILQAQFEVMERLKVGVKNEDNIILDQLNLNPTARRKKLLRVPPEVYTRVAVALEEDTEVLLKRNKERLDKGMGLPESVLKRYVHTYVPPTISEGFDEIWKGGEIRQA